METRKVSELEALNALSENARLMVIENGSAKSINIFGNVDLTDEQKKKILENIGAIRANETAKVGDAIVVKALDENGMPIEWEYISLSENENSDWNANEGESGYIQNRPFYTKKDGKVVPLDEKYLPKEAITALIDTYMDDALGGDY